MTERLPDGFVDAVREADEHIQRTTPPRQDARDQLLRDLRVELDRPTPLTFLTPNQWGAVAAAAAVAIAFGAARFMASDDPAPPLPGDASVADATDTPWTGEGLSSSSCTGTASGSATRLGQGCTFAWAEAEAEVVAVGDVVVSRRAERELEVRDGALRFLVDHERDKTKPVRVHVTGGTIEVVGTIFTVTQDLDAGRGDVALERGAITFTALDGAVTTLAPGESLSGGDTQEDASAVASTDTAGASGDAPGDAAARERTAPERKPRRPKKKRTAAELERDRELTRRELDDVQNMRRLGKHGAALEKLRDLEDIAPDMYTREVISYEIGDILTNHRSKKKACSHWSRHTRRFQRSIYKGAIATKRADLGCR